jgi:hypothetical protein
MIDHLFFGFGAIRVTVNDIRWYHTMELENGVRTAGFDDTPRKIARLGLPPGLTERHAST